MIKTMMPDDFAEDDKRNQICKVVDELIKKYRRLIREEVNNIPDIKKVQVSSIILSILTLLAEDSIYSIIKIHNITDIDNFINEIARDMKENVKEFIKNERN